jgi:hypothetical protein
MARTQYAENVQRMESGSMQLLADRCILWGSCIDCGPVLLRWPFGDQALLCRQALLR